MAKYLVQITTPPVCVGRVIDSDRPPTREELLKLLHVEADLLPDNLPAGMKLDLGHKKNFDIWGQYAAEVVECPF